VATDDLTLIIMHSPKAEPKTISIRRKWLLVAAGALVVFVGFSAFSGFRAMSDAIDEARLTDLQRENRLLRSEIASLNDKVARFETEMARHVEFEERVRILADIEPMDEDLWEVGVGGPEIVSALGLAGPVVNEITSLNEDVDRLLRQIKLQRHSYTDILNRLKEKAEDLKHIPSIRPVDVGYISSYFGRRHDPFTGRISRHEGLDFSARKGSNIYATADGKVLLAKYDRGYGYTVEIDHGDGIITKYAHNAKNLVKRGQRVERGDVIAYLGSSGRSTAPHLHYEVRVGDVAQNPLKFIVPSDIIVD
jgi:murein DD-endopeptidase MepM/ murein hydrolase activator NlpD